MMPQDPVLGTKYFSFYLTTDGLGCSMQTTKCIPKSDSEHKEKKSFKLTDIRPHMNLTAVDPGRTDLATGVNFKDIVMVPIKHQKPLTKADNEKEQRNEKFSRRAWNIEEKRHEKPLLNKWRSGIGADLLKNAAFRRAADPTWEADSNDASDSMDTSDSISDDASASNDASDSMDTSDSATGDAKASNDASDSMDTSSDNQGESKKVEFTRKDFQERFRPVHISNAEWHSRAGHNMMKEKRRLHLTRASEEVRVFFFFQICITF